MSTIRHTHTTTRRWTLGAATLGACACLAACAAPAQGDAADAATATVAHSATATAAHSATAADTGAAVATNAATTAGAGATAVPAGETEDDQFPLVGLAPVPTDEVQKGSEEGDTDVTIPAAAVENAARVAYGSHFLDCEGPVSTGQPGRCRFTDSNGTSTITMTAYAVQKGGKNGYGVLFVQGRDLLPDELADLVQNGDSMVMGERISGDYAKTDHDAASLQQDVVRTIQDPNAMLPWSTTGNPMKVDEISCHTGLTANSLDPGTCDLTFDSGLDMQATALPATFGVDGGETGLIVIVNGTE